MTILEYLADKDWSTVNHIAKGTKKTAYETKLKLNDLVEQGKIDVYFTNKFSNKYRIKKMTVLEKAENYIDIFGLELAKKCVGQIILNCDLNKKGYFCAVLDELEKR